MQFIPAANIDVRPTPVWQRLGAFALAAAAVGLPVNDLVSYGALLAAAVVLWSNAVSGERRRWIAALASAGVAVAGHMLLPAPRIAEGANVFLIPQDGSTRNRTGLPDEAFTYLAAAFDAQYPPQTRCNDRARGCWRLDGPQQNGFAFAADGIYDRDRHDFSRRVRGIGFSDPASLRLGVINDLAYNWLDEDSDIKRFDRARRPAKIFGRYTLLLPVFVTYRFPAAFSGGDLCWRGDLLWESPGEHFDLVRHDTISCQTLVADDTGRRIVGVSIQHDHPLAMTLRAPWSVTAARAVEIAFMLLGVAGVTLSLTASPGLAAWRRTILPFTLLGFALTVVALDDFDFIGGLRPLDGGDDGIVYEGYGREIVRFLLTGDVMSALKGMEPVFFFTPLLRYVRAVEMLVFGDTFLLYLSALIAIPLMTYAACRRFMPQGWAITLALVFTATPFGAVFGSSFYLFARAAGRGYPDAFAYTLFLGGLLLLVQRMAQSGLTAADARNPTRAFWGCLLLALAVMTRPNLLLASGVMVAAAAAFALYDRAAARLAAIVAGFSVLLLSPLHNWVFGGSLVPFSDNMIRPETMRMLPSAYFKAAWELMRFDFAGENLRGAVVQMSHWLSGPAEILATIPVNAAAVALLAYVAILGRRHDRWLRAIALAALMQHGIGLCYVIYDRYHLLTWLLTALVFWAWLAREGLPLFAARAPHAYARLAAAPPMKWIAAMLERSSEVFARA